jgi:hypothetical protein
LPGKTLKPGDHNAGYKKVSLYDVNQKRYTFLIHRLVLEAFVGKRPEKMDGCHNNGDKTDNRLVNLRWDTRRNNNLDAVLHRRNANSRKDACPKCGSEYSLRPNSNRRYCKPCKWEYQSKYRKEKEA